jgi:hypothetical protein
MSRFTFRDRQWVCTDSAYAALLAQGYVTFQIQTRHGVRWRLMVLA